MDNLKHVGRLKANSRKVVVAYRTLPGESDSALVISTESLSDAQHDSLMKLVESPAGQNSYEFAEVLARTTFPEGGLMLNTLHFGGKLIKIKTSEVEMTPNTLTAIGLDDLNQMIAEQRGISVNDLALGNQSSVHEIAQINEVDTKTVNEQVSSTNVTETVEITNFESPEAEAKFYRSQADKLSKQAAEMRRKAEELAPTKKKVKAEA